MVASRGMLALFIAIAAAAPPDALDGCRKSYDALDPGRMIEPCAAAASDDGLSAADRAAALRILGIAYVALRDDEAAVSAFRRMLALDANAAVGDDAGPGAQRAFLRAMSEANGPRRTTAPVGPEPVAAAAPGTAPADSDAAPVERGPEDAVPAATAPASPTQVAAFGLAGAGALVAIGAGSFAGLVGYELFFRGEPCDDAARCVPVEPGLIVPGGGDRVAFYSDTGPTLLIASAAVAGISATVGVAALGLALRE